MESITDIVAPIPSKICHLVLRGTAITHKVYKKYLQVIHIFHLISGDLSFVLQF